jgi:hypothetical protein
MKLGSGLTRASINSSAFRVDVVLNSYHLVSSFPPAVVADVLGEGDKVFLVLVD